jgi:CRISPR-associated protein Cmr2
LPTDWEDVLLSYLHDPPDKATDIRGHEGRAALLAGIALRREVGREGMHRETRTEDQFGSVSERLPMPTAGDKGERAVGPEDGRLIIYHPLSGAPALLGLGRLEGEAPKETLAELVQGLELPRQRLLALWRHWRDGLAGRAADWARLPADTRLPDHTIWNHLDIVAGLRPALSGNHGAALLSFSLGPVQTFIAAARTVRDLWAGSYLLSWLTFRAMGPLLDEVGPAAFVFPALRGNPLVDCWLRDQGLSGLVAGPDAERLLLPCLPNRFVAVVPWGPDGADARRLAGACERSCRAGWQEVARAVHRLLDRHFRPLPHSADWDRLWWEQVESCFEVRTAVLPERQCRDEAFRQLLDGEMLRRIADVRSLADAIPAGHRPGYPQQSAGLWMGQMEVLARLSEARRAVRHVPDCRPAGDVPAKCGLLGTYEQMGPAALAEGNAFWAAAADSPPPGGTRLNPGERLCAVSLVKRFAWPAFFARHLGLPPQERRFSDTATVASAPWLRGAEGLDPDATWRREGRWSGQWLHWARPDQDRDEEAVPHQVWERIKAAKKAHGLPPTYYAVLMIDGDHMGRWLRGENAPSVGEVLHPRLRAYFERLPAARGLAARRPVGPALHASISEALTNFALHFVPGLVSRYDGTLIYAGGDDVLALLPAACALACARELSEAFRQDWGQDAQGGERLLMGQKASVSAGLAVVHHKEDLRFALDAARRAERLAKDGGRDALVLTICRRSGEHSSALLPWGLCPSVECLVGIFAGGASDRWAYKLRAELPTLRSTDLPWGLVRAEAGRLLDRLEQADRDRLRGPALEFLDDYHSAMRGTPRGRTAAEALEGFVTLCQAAAFLARGRDER